MNKMRLNHYLLRCRICSRFGIVRWIELIPITKFFGCKHLKEGFSKEPSGSFRDQIIVGFY